MNKNSDKKSSFRIPDAPRAILKGSSLKDLLDQEAIDCLSHNISLVHPSFEGKSFQKDAMNGLLPLGIIERGHHLSHVLRKYLPQRYEKAIDVLLNSLTPPLKNGDGNGLGVFFYLPHVCFVANYGLDDANNGGEDPFDVSMKAQYELTRRFSAEFSIRPFLIRFQERTLEQLNTWTKDPDVHVRRLCSEGTRPRLPWATRISVYIKDPKPVLPILEALKDDQELYVRRSVANHLGDIAKDHPDLVIEICKRWLEGASADRRWIIRHALRHPAKKGIQAALRLRKSAA